MSFIDTEFLIFFASVFGIYWLLHERRRQNIFLLLVSYVFYGWFQPWLVLLLFGVTLLNYLAARGIVRWPEWKDLILGFTIVTAIGILCAFKYFDWFVGAVITRLATPETLKSFQLLHVVLPLGLSFYTFHNLAYTIDVYRGRFEVRKDPIDYLLYGCYFPQLVAGPVERAANVLPQFEQHRRFNGERVLMGLGLALWGGFKKVALADSIAPHVDMMFLHPDPSWAMVWTGALGFTIQALADFSGYTDIARGISMMLGIELMDNFASPYMAATPMEFWQRWHISFSTWLRDYIYLPSCFSPWISRYITLPFSGDWGPFANTTRALLITMMVSGIWHGSTWNYILWGFYYFVIGTIYAGIVAKLPKKLKKDGRWRWLTVPIMFGFTVFGMNIFREPSLSRLWENLHRLPWEGTPEQGVVAASMLGVCAFAALPLITALLMKRYVRPALEGSPWLLPLQTTVWALCAVGIFSAVRTSATDFIYFQF